MNNDFIAVLVLYKLNLFESTTFKTLLLALKKDEQVLDLIVYDNSPIINKQIIKEESKYFNVHIISDTSNPGVSKAYNIAASLGIKKGKKWLLIFDQDTSFPTDIFFKYNYYINLYPSVKLFAPLIFDERKKVISPSKFKFNRGFTTTNKQTGLRSIADYSLINCGLCINLNSFRALNGYNEFFKLDYSDHDFINRFKAQISKCVVIIDAEVNHKLSSTNKQTFLEDTKRFKYFNQAVLKFSEIHGGKFYSISTILLRCLKLSFLHKSFNFIKIIKLV